MKPLLLTPPRTGSRFNALCAVSRAAKILLLSGWISSTVPALHGQNVPDSLWVKESAVLQWDFEGTTNGWTVASTSVTNLRSEAGCLMGSSIGTDPNITTAAPKLQLRGSAGIVARVWFSQASTLQLYWSNDEGGFDPSRVAQQAVPAQQWTTVRFDLSAHPQWSGKTVQGLRIDPGTATGLTFAIDYLAAVDRLEDRDGALVTKTYDFNTDNQGWATTSTQVSNYRWEDGKLKGTSTGIDPNFTGPVISHANQGGVAVQVKSNVNTTFAIYWSTTEGGFSQTRTASLPVTDAGWQTLYFDLRAYSTWAGKTVTRLRLDPGIVTGQDFEIDSVLILKPQAFDDADGDRLCTFAERLHFSDPAVSSSLRGRLAAEKWSPMTHYSTRSLVADGAFYAPAATLSTLKEATTGAQPDVYNATRIRGYILAPSTGDYRFWISGRNGVELYLSDDSSKYRKRRIAEINPELGDGHGIPYGDTNLWDQTSSQMSQAIHLEQGVSYYFETLQAEGHAPDAHVSIAWAPPGAGRSLVSTACLKSYAPEGADTDDDYLPDAWETQYGLDPQDNGRIDLARQGERGDLDGDGLSNREEYLLGTDPANSDTDGDGESDGNEVNALGSNALVANAITDTYLSEVALGAFTSSSTAWTMTSGGLLADSFRGEATWSFSVPSAGNWLLRLDLELMGMTYGNEEVPMVILVDGKTVVRRNVRFGSGKYGLLQALTPWLSDGEHSVTVLVDNALARRTVRLVSLKIYEPANANATLAQGNRVLAHPAASRTSPAFIEGYARDPASVTVNAAAAEIGTGSGHWFTNVPLADVADLQTHTIHYEQGWETTGTLSWQATNVMDGESLVIRAGDSLRVGAWSGDLLLTSTISGPSGGSITLTGAETSVMTFSTAGIFTVTGTRQNGTSAILTVKAVAAPSFPGGTLDALDSCVRTLSVSAGPEVAFETQEQLARLIVTRTATSASVGILPAGPGDLAVAARLYSGGPILAVQRVNVIGVSDALENDLTSAATADIPGYKLLTTPLTILNLPPGGRVDVQIVRAGVMFPNGTFFKSLYPNDLTNGSVNLQFLFPIGQSGGYCHSLLVYGRTGVYLGTR